MRDRKTKFFIWRQAQEAWTTGGTVHVTLIADDTVEITENDYYICLASLHASEDNVLPFEEPEIDAEDDLDEREYESNRPKRNKRMTVKACDFVYYWAN